MVSLAKHRTIFATNR